MKVSFVVPVFRGAGMGEGELGHRLASEYPDSTIIAVYNGLPAEETPNLPAPFWPVWSQAGLRSALEVGYQAYVNQGKEQPLIRSDSDEHPSDRFGELAELALQTNGLVVGDLIYSDELMPPETPEHLAYQIWQVMYGEVTRGAATVGNAHGLLILPSPAICRKLLETARPILDRADRQAGEPVQWGHDGVMIMAAVAAGVPLSVIPIQAREIRNRTENKILAQFRRHFLIARMAASVYPDRLG